MILDATAEAISTTDLQRRGKEMLDQLQIGPQKTFVVMRNNKQVAVLVALAAYEAMVQELNDLRAKRG